MRTPHRAVLVALALAASVASGVPPSSIWAGVNFRIPIPRGGTEPNATNAVTGGTTTGGNKKKKVKKVKKRRRKSTKSETVLLVPSGEGGVEVTEAMETEISGGPHHPMPEDSPAPDGYGKKMKKMKKRKKVRKVSAPPRMDTWGRRSELTVEGRPQDFPSDSNAERKDTLDAEPEAAIKKKRKKVVRKKKRARPAFIVPAEDGSDDKVGIDENVKLQLFDEGETVEETSDLPKKESAPLSSQHMTVVEEDGVADFPEAAIRKKRKKVVRKKKRVRPAFIVPFEDGPADKVDIEKNANLQRVDKGETVAEASASPEAESAPLSSQQMTLVEELGVADVGGVEASRSGDGAGGNAASFDVTSMEVTDGDGTEDKDSGGEDTDKYDFLVQQRRTSGDVTDGNEDEMHTEPEVTAKKKRRKVVRKKRRVKSPVAIPADDATSLEVESDEAAEVQDGDEDVDERNDQIDATVPDDFASDDTTSVEVHVTEVSDVQDGDFERDEINATLVEGTYAAPDTIGHEADPVVEASDLPHGETAPLSPQPTTEAVDLVVEDAESSSSEGEEEPAEDIAADEEDNDLDKPEMERDESVVIDLTVSAEEGEEGGETQEDGEAGRIESDHDETVDDSMQPVGSGSEELTEESEEEELAVDEGQEEEEEVGELAVPLAETEEASDTTVDSSATGETVDAVGDVDETASGDVDETLDVKVDEGTSGMEVVNEVLIGDDDALKSSSGVDDDEMVSQDEEAASAANDGDKIEGAVAADAADDDDEIEAAAVADEEEGKDMDGLVVEPDSSDNETDTVGGSDMADDDELGTVATHAVEPAKDIREEDEIDAFDKQQKDKATVESEATPSEVPPGSTVGTSADTSVEEFEQESDDETDITVSIITWNLAELSPSEEEASFLRQFRHSPSSRLSSDKSRPSSVGRDSGSDIVLISGQECENTKPRRAEGHRSREFRRLMIHMLGKNYVPLAIHSLGGVQLGLFCRRAILGEVEHVSVADVACGIGNVFHNKGAIGAFVQMKARQKSGLDDGQVGHPRLSKSLRMLFVTAHMAAHVKNVEARNMDFWRIASELEVQAPPRFLPPPPRPGGSSRPLDGVPEAKSESVEGGGGSHLLNSMDRIFFCGDLNYRVDLPREATEHAVSEIARLREESCATDGTDPTSEISTNGKEQMADSLRMELLRHDQLLRTMAEGRAFPNFAEGKITFPPTFKFDKGTTVYDTSHKQRVLAWTDRVIFKPFGVRVLEYQSVGTATHSDHRPVYASFRVSMAGRELPGGKGIPRSGPSRSKKHGEKDDKSSGGDGAASRRSSKKRRRQGKPKSKKDKDKN